MPVNGLVEFHHTCFGSGVLDKPAVERIVKNRLIGTPTVRIVVCMFLNIEGFASHFHLHTHHDVKVFRLFRCFLVPHAIRIETWVVGILHVVAGVFAVSLLVYTGFDKVLVEFV